MKIVSINFAYLSTSQIIFVFITTMIMILSKVNALNIKESGINIVFALAFKEQYSHLLPF